MWDLSKIFFKKSRLVRAFKNIVFNIHVLWDLPKICFLKVPLLWKLSKKKKNFLIHVLWEPSKIFSLKTAPFERPVKIFFLKNHVLWEISKKKIILFWELSEILFSCPCLLFSFFKKKDFLKIYVLSVSI